MGAEQQPVQRQETHGIPRRVVLGMFRDVGAGLVIFGGPTFLLTASAPERHRPQAPTGPLFAPQQETQSCETIRSLVLPHSLPIPDQLDQLFTNPTAWDPIQTEFKRWQEVTTGQYPNTDLLFSLGANVGYPEDTADSLQQAKNLAEKLIRHAARQLGIEYSTAPYLFLDQTRQTKPNLSVIANTYVC